MEKERENEPRDRRIRKKNMKMKTLPSGASNTNNSLKTEDVKLIQRFHWEGAIDF